jgi:hypothetical protein
MKKHISDFYNYLTTNHPDYANKNYYYSSKINHNDGTTKLVSHLRSLPIADFRKLISDPHWNSYPLFTINYGKGAAVEPNPKNYYRFINMAVKQMIFVDHKYRKEFMENSEGAFRISTIGNTLGKEKLKAAKIGLKSRDVRVRKLAAELLPIKDVMSIVNSEKNYSVLSKLSRRIGYLNMIKVEKNSSYRYKRSHAFLNDEFDGDEIRDILSKREMGKSSTFYERDILQKVAYHISTSELPFYLDVLNKLSSFDEDGKRLFLAKLTGHSDA